MICNIQWAKSSIMVELEQIFTDLYDQNADAVFRLCLFKTSDREVALDLSQDIFTKLWAYLEAGNTADNPRALLYTIARNHIKDYYKKRKTPNATSLHIESFDDLVSSSDITSDKAEVEEVLMIIQKLPEKHRELIQLRYVEGLSIEEMAIIFSTRPNTLAVKIHRILQKIRETL